MMQSKLPCRVARNSGKLRAQPHLYSSSIRSGNLDSPFSRRDKGTLEAEQKGRGEHSEGDAVGKLQQLCNVSPGRLTQR